MIEPLSQVDEEMKRVHVEQLPYLEAKKLPNHGKMFIEVDRGKGTKFKSLISGSYVLKLDNPHLKEFPGKITCYLLLGNGFANDSARIGKE